MPAWWGVDGNTVQIDRKVNGNANGKWAGSGEAEGQAQDAGGTAGRGRRPAGPGAKKAAD
jgi:hypothetical protein